MSSLIVAFCHLIYWQKNALHSVHKKIVHLHVENTKPIQRKNRLFLKIEENNKRY